MEMSPNQPLTARAILFRHDPWAAVGEDHNEIHHHEHQVVVPAICFLTPKSRVPDKDFLVNRSRHYEDESQRGELRPDPENDGGASQNFGSPEKNREVPALADTLGALFGISQILPAAIHEDNSYHQSQQQESEWYEPGKASKHHGCKYR
jgi:hypothetical protein